jgi:hypothetical protein
MGCRRLGVRQRFVETNISLETGGRRELLVDEIVLQRRREWVVSIGCQKQLKKARTGRWNRSSSLIFKKEVRNRQLMMIKKSWVTSEMGMGERCMAETGHRKQVLVVVQRRRERVVINIRRLERVVVNVQRRLERVVVGTGHFQCSKKSGTGCPQCDVQEQRPGHITKNQASVIVQIRLERQVVGTTGN